MLEITGLQAGYGAITVLWDVSITFRQGRTTAIIGPNGAGKTTLLRAVMGLVVPGRGEIRLGGASITRRATWDRVRDGLVLVPEGRLVFRDMSVEDNLIMGAFVPARRPRATANMERVFTTFPRLKERRGQMAGTLSGGEAQMLALGRALMEEPKLLLIDEPSLGLAPVVIDEIFRTIRGLKAEGLTIVVVEQNTHRALAVADDVHLMQSGRVVLSTTPAEMDLDQLHEAYFAGTGAEAPSQA